MLKGRQFSKRVTDMLMEDCKEMQDTYKEGSSSSGIGLMNAETMGAYLNKAQQYKKRVMPELTEKNLLLKKLLKKKLRHTEKEQGLSVYIKMEVIMNVP